MQRRKGKQPSALERGRRFEGEEKAGWVESCGERLVFERRIVDPQGKVGRLDIFVETVPHPWAGEPDAGVGVGEIKATNWDRVKMVRVRALALRHTRQTWRYIGAQLENGHSVCAGVIYPVAPKSTAKRKVVEAALDERGLQCVWRKSRRDMQKVGSGP